MKPVQIENLLNLFTVLFVVMVVLMSVNEFGANVMTLILATILLSGLLHPGEGLSSGDVPLGLGQKGGLIGMSLLDLDQYYSVTDEKFQFPGWDKDRDGMEHASDIIVRVIITLVLLAYFINSGIFKIENLNPIKRFMMM
jgi:hypothetical protein